MPPSFCIHNCLCEPTRHDYWISRLIAVGKPRVLVLKSTESVRVCFYFKRSELSFFQTCVTPEPEGQAAEERVSASMTHTIVAQRSMYHGTGALKQIEEKCAPPPLWTHIPIPIPPTTNFSSIVLYSTRVLYHNRAFFQLFAPTICEAELQAAQHRLTYPRSTVREPASQASIRHRGAFCFSQPTALGSYWPGSNEVYEQ
ncbi:hypothetical protein V496_09953 [Pseudogymnoascus sp. VKM F-4515 (FW-2607)]|nr:hypothetical protein V496_09953 [Pseudogymnoascus sp. VKM F-4515 (FW-2607)]